MLVIIGNAEYPSLPWLVKPFPEFILSEEEYNFNFRHSSARMTIEKSFGLLKSRWRILLKRQDNEFHNLHYYIVACFILHNICINNLDHINKLWDVRYNNYILDTRNVHINMREFILNKL